ncbi:MAG: hypothetical protein FNP40_15305 [Dehalobacter sp. 4CP]|uniref:hypothetical protein n=1 Tax=Dehalobacter sp. CP TaxID=2594474 RepID=UPI0013C610D8|nr:hypothetical protein [Dehalobacter sp.]NBJ16891.1 hypothetical protein [Dehalobacter sp. 4CP]
MDKSDLILEKLNSMEKALRTEIKMLSDKQNEFTERQNEFTKKQNEFSEKQDMTWQAIREMRDELTNNSLKIKIIDNKVKAL